MTSRLQFQVIVFRVVYSPSSRALYSMADAAPLVIRAMLTPTVFLLMGGFAVSAALSKFQTDVKVRARAVPYAAAGGVMHACVHAHRYPRNHASLAPS
jgi:hypothetical protein